MHSRRQAVWRIRASAGLVQTHGRKTSARCLDRANAGEGVVSPAWCRGGQCPAPRRKSLWLDATEGSSIVSGHAGHASERFVDASNKMQLDLCGPSLEIT